MPPATVIRAAGLRRGSGVPAGRPPRRPRIADSSKNRLDLGRGTPARRARPRAAASAWGGRVARRSGISASRLGSSPSSVFVPCVTVTGRSVLSRSVKHGTPSTVVSSWTPPESVTTAARLGLQREEAPVRLRVDEADARRAAIAERAQARRASAGAPGRRPAARCATRPSAAHRGAQELGARRRARAGAGSRGRTRAARGRARSPDLELDARRRRWPSSVSIIVLPTKRIARRGDALARRGSRTPPASG